MRSDQDTVASTDHGKASEDVLHSGSTDDTVAATLHGLAESSEPQPQAKLAPGRTLGRYVVLDRIGRGGMGTVLRAYDHGLDRAVALKLLHPGAPEHYARRLEREAKALAKLSHPNVVHVYEVGQHEGQWFIAMELVKGRTLREWQRTPHDWRETVDVYLEAAAGLRAAHAQGMVHRDFKPDNCVIDEQGRLRVLDFGLVRQTQATEKVGEQTDAMRTRPGKILGTLGYMPLEQIGGKPVDARSDQFSFCASLYEALYGVRPFPAEEIGPLTAAMMMGEIDPPPRGARVPSRLRRALLQGLQTHAEDRWPSMESLSAELQHMLAPARTWWWIPAVGVVAVAGVAAVAIWQRTESEPPCVGSAQQLAGLWDEAQRERVSRAMVETGVPYAPSAWERAERQLDDYAAAWTAEHEDACAATQVRHEQSERVMDLRMACLRRARGQLAATVDLLAEADDEIVARAHSLLGGLPSLGRCADTKALLADVPPPADPAVAAAVDRGREVLSRVHALRAAAKPQQAREQLDAMVSELEAIDYVPLRCELSYARGMVHHDLGEYAEAEATLRATLVDTLAHDQWQSALEAAIALTNTVNHGRGAPDEALGLAEVGVGLAQREDVTASDQAVALLTLATVFRRQSRWAEAEARIREALEILERSEGDDPSPKLAQTHNNLANILNIQGHFEQAEAEYERARAMYVQTLGPAHPTLADSLTAYAGMLTDQGKLDEALELSREAVAIHEAAFGPEHPATAAALNTVAVVLQAQGELEEAADAFRTIITRLAAAHGPEHPWVGGARTNLANTLYDLGRFEEAEREIRPAIDTIDASAGETALAGAAPRVVLAKILIETDRLAEAEQAARAALEIRTKAHGREHRDVFASHYMVGGILSRRGQIEDAIDQFERGLRIEGLESLRVDQRVELRSRYARMLWDSGRDRSRAATLMHEARRMLGEDSDFDELRQQLDAWIESHPPDGTAASKKPDRAADPTEG